MALKLNYNDLTINQLARDAMARFGFCVIGFAPAAMKNPIRKRLRDWGGVLLRGGATLLVLGKGTRAQWEAQFKAFFPGWPLNPEPKGATYWRAKFVDRKNRSGVTRSRPRRTGAKTARGAEA